MQKFAHYLSLPATNDLSLAPVPNAEVCIFGCNFALHAQNPAVTATNDFMGSRSTYMTVCIRIFDTITRYIVFVITMFAKRKIQMQLLAVFCGELRFNF